MHWVLKHSPIFFDVDGLLVDTDRLHFQADQTMLKKRNCSLPWDLTTFLSIAHKNATGLKAHILALFPELHSTDWDILYAEKKAVYMELVQKGALKMMPGAKRMLTLVSEENIPHAVVTNSTKSEIEAIQKHLPDLKTIPTWIVREDYQSPKPAPDAYLKALEVLGETAENCIGFEDSLRGVDSLIGAHIKPVLICLETHPQMSAIKNKEVKHFTSFEALF